MKQYLLILLLLSLGLANSAYAEPTVIKTYILSGQSNGNGYGLAYGEVSTGELIPHQDLATIDREDLLTVNESVDIYLGDWTTGLGNWDKLGPGFASWNGVRFGSELSFGNKVQAALDEPIAIIKYTPNGTSLYSEWLEDSYDRLMAAVSDAKFKATALDITLDIQGLLWMQGESDSFGVNAPAAYEERLTSFVAKVRDGLAIPELKFHIAEIPDSGAWAARQQIWDAQAAVVAADEHSYLVKSRSFPLFENDGAGSIWIHYSTEGIVMLGEAFANSVLTTDEPISPEPEDDQTISNGYISHLVGDDSIVIDAILDDWSTVPSLGYDADALTDAGVKADYQEGWIAHDSNNLYIAYQNDGEIDESLWWPWQIYFDTDGASVTGFKADDKIGAEYMLEASGIYRYSGSGTNWSWQFIADTTHAVSGDIAEFKIPRLALKFSDKLSVIFKTRNAVFTGSYASTGVDVYPKAVKAIPLHTELLRSQSVIWQEPGGELAMTLASDAIAGATTLEMADSYQLFDNQLLTYLAQDDEYYTTQVASVDGNTINLSVPLEAPVAAGQHLWNFYEDGSHPNQFGFRAVTDFAIRKIGSDKLASATHVLMGDSWFDKLGQYAAARLQERISDATIINRSVGGNTSADVLENFDTNIAGQNPDFVWVIVGLNDATSSVDVADYLSNMQGILSKIRASGAEPIILGPQVAQLFFGSDEFTQLSHDYAAGLATLDSTLKYELTAPVTEPEPDAISNPETIAIDGELADWSELESFGLDGDDINGAGTKADFIEAWMAHDDESFYFAYQNDGDIDTVISWPWQIYLDTDNKKGTGYLIGGGVGANYLIQGGYLFSYIGTGFDWSWKYEASAEHVVKNGIAELKLPRSAISNPDSLGLLLKARNGIFTGDYSESGVDSYPDLDEGHFNYDFVNTAPEEEIEAL